MPRQEMELLMELEMQLVEAINLYYKITAEQKNKGAFNKDPLIDSVMQTITELNFSIGKLEDRVSQKPKESVILTRQDKNEMRDMELNRVRNEMEKPKPKPKPKPKRKLVIRNELVPLVPLDEVKYKTKTVKTKVVLSKEQKLVNRTVNKQIKAQNIPMIASGSANLPASEIGVVKPKRAYVRKTPIAELAPRKPYKKRQTVKTTEIPVNNYIVTNEVEL